MSKVAVVYWSGTGNTEAMANRVAEGAQNAGADTHDGADWAGAHTIELQAGLIHEHIGNQESGESHLEGHPARF